MKTKKMSEKSIVQEVKKGFEKNFAVKTEKKKVRENPLSPELLRKMDAYWRAANYLSVGQIYLYDNPLLKRPLTLANVKHMLLGHWGTTPGQLIEHKQYIDKYGEDLPEIRNWKWGLTRE